MIETGVAGGASGAAFLALNAPMKFVPEIRKRKRLAQLIRRSRTALEGAVLFAKHLDSRVALRHLAQPLRARTRCLEVVRMFHLARKLSAQHGPSCSFGFVPSEVCLHGVVSIECGLQAESLGAVRHRCFVRIL